MSECPIDQPTDEVLRPLPHLVGRSPLTTIDASTDTDAAAPDGGAGAASWDVPDPEVTEAATRAGEAAEARFRAFVDRARRRALTTARYGTLGRFDHDHDRGSLLYDAVVFQDTSRLTDHGWLDRLEAITRLKARLAALEAAAIAGFDDALHGVSADLGHRHPEPGDRDATAGERRWIAGDLRSVSDEIGLVLHLHRGAATSRIHTSCELVHNFPATLHALTEGELTERAAFTIVSELSVLDDLDDLRAAEAAMLDWARTHPLQKIKQACRQEVARRSPAATDKAHKRALDERAVRMFPNDIGTAELVHTQDGIDAAAIMTSLSRAAQYRRRKGDPRSMDQLRADIALARLLPRTQRATAADEPATTEPAASEPFADEPADRDAPPESDRDYDDTTPVDCAPFDPEPADDEPAAYDPCDLGPVGNNYDHTEPVDDWPVDNEPADHGDVYPAASGGAGTEYDDADTDQSDPDPGDPDCADPGAADPDDWDSRYGGDDADAMDEATNGADATVIIHATGAEVRALINGEECTGGEAERLGPIPQSSLRKHLIKALAQTLLPNLPTTPTSTRLGAAVRRARSRVDIHVIDEPPASDPDRYTPSAALDRWVRLRDRVCRFPGCNRPAEFTDVDHRVAFAAGGRTTADNLWCLCRHHHRLKHEGGWTIHPHPDGSYTWISPTGRQYRDNTPDTPPDTDPGP